MHLEYTPLAGVYFFFEIMLRGSSLQITTVGYIRNSLWARVP